MIDHTLKPLINLDEKMKQINEDNLNQRIETAGGNNELITAVLEELHSIISEKHLVIHKKYDDYYVKGNAILLYRALFNLVENAVKYNKESGEIKIEVKRGGEEIYIFIKDNGMGIPKDCINNIFEAFYRVDSSRARELGGAGLGLTLTKHIIERHKGSISVESKEGKGTLFEVKLNEYHKK